MITLNKEDNLATAIRYINSKKLKNKHGIYCVWLKTSNLEGFTDFWAKRTDLYEEAKAANNNPKTYPKLPELSGETAFEKDGYILLYIGKTTSLDAELKAHMSIAETTSALKLFGSNMKSKKLNAEAKEIMAKDNRKAPFIDGIKMTYVNCWKELGHVEALLHQEYKRLIGTTESIADEAIECDLEEVSKKLGLI